MSETTFIYALIDPRDNCVRYIGKSDSPYTRLAGHLKPNTQLTSAKSKWVGELTKVHLRPRLLILEEVLVAEWEAREQAWIKFFGKALTNGTPGGRSSWNQAPADKLPLTHRVVKLPPEDAAELQQVSPQRMTEIMRCGLRSLRIGEVFWRYIAGDIDFAEAVALARCTPEEFAWVLRGWGVEPYEEDDGDGPESA